MGRSNFLEGVVTRIDGEVCGVRTSRGLDLRVRSHRGVTSGSRVVVQMRAEHLQLHNTCPASGNSLPGRIVHRMFLGNRTEYQVSLSSGDELVVVGPVGSPLAPGDAVWVTATPTDCVVLPDGAMAV